MIKLLAFLEILFSVIMVLWEIIEILLIPAVLTVIGIFNRYSCQYYVISIAGYFIATIIIQLICHFAFNRFEKKYTPTFQKLLIRFFDTVFPKK